MAKKESRAASRIRRHQRVRRKIFGTPNRPRLCVFRSLNEIYVQVIDDLAGHTLVAASTIDSTLKDELEDLTKTEQARRVGERVAKRAIDQGIKEVVFDNGGFRYIGRVKALAEGAREGGLKF